MAPTDAVTLCLVTIDPHIEAAVRVSCRASDTLIHLNPKGLLGADRVLSPEGQQIVEQASSTDVVLIAWALDKAPVINTLCHHIRRRSHVPVMALCRGGQQEMIAALAAGVDDVLTFPLYIPLLQAKIAAITRLIEAVQRARTRLLQRHLQRRQPNVQSLAANHLDALAGEMLDELGEVMLLDASDQSTENRDLLLEAEKVLEVETEKVVQDLVADVVEEFVEVTGNALTLIDARHEVYRFGNLALDTTTYRFHVGNHEVDLTPKEFALLRFLIEHAETACSRDRILTEVWGIDFDTGTNMVDVYMHFVRRKLEANGFNGKIETIRGHGYRLSLPKS